MRGGVWCCLTVRGGVWCWMAVRGGVWWSGEAVRGAHRCVAM